MLPLRIAGKVSSFTTKTLFRFILGRPPPTAVLKGQEGEDIVYRILTSKYNNVKKTNKTPESGDFIIDNDIMIEVKNYSSTVPTLQVLKFQRDLNNLNIRAGIFISLNTHIAKHSSFDICESPNRIEIYISSKKSEDILRAIKISREWLDKN